MELRNTTEKERNNKLAMYAHGLDAVIMITFCVLQAIVGRQTIGYAVIVAVLGLVPVIAEYIFWSKDRENSKIKILVPAGFAVFYTFTLLTAENNLVFVFAIPIVLVISVYNDPVYSVLVNAGMILESLLVVMVGAKTGRCGYVDYDSAVLQVVVMIMIGIYSFFTTITLDKNNYQKMQELIEEKRKAEYLATHDYLTGLYNRNYLMLHFDDFKQAERFPISVALLNINGLKLINDFYGNKVGDRVIEKVSEVIKQRMDENHTAIRLDGDEYLVVMYRTSEKDAKNLLYDISEDVRRDKENDMEITLEYGIAVIESEETTMDDCIARARNTMHQKKMLNQKSVRSSIVESLKNSLRASDFETEEHAERTKNMAIRMGQKLKLSDKEQSELGLLAILHDIGKLSIPHEILTKPGKLNEEEWKIMQTHAAKGCEMAGLTAELKPIADYILHHHERWDGKGYPMGLAGEDIPLLSRIITIVDSHDVMTHDRPYHKAISEEAAEEELMRCSGTQFDPELVKIFIGMMHEKIQTQEMK